MLLFALHTTGGRFSGLALAMMLLLFCTIAYGAVTYAAFHKPQLPPKHLSVGLTLVPHVFHMHSVLCEITHLFIHRSFDALSLDAEVPQLHLDSNDVLSKVEHFSHSSGTHKHIYICASKHMNAVLFW